MGGGRPRLSGDPFPTQPCEAQARLAGIRPNAERRGTNTACRRPLLGLEVQTPSIRRSTGSRHGRAGGAPVASSHPARGGCHRFNLGNVDWCGPLRHLVTPGSRTPPHIRLSACEGPSGIGPGRGNSPGAGPGRAVSSALRGRGGPWLEVFHRASSFRVTRCGPAVWVWTVGA